MSADFSTMAKKARAQISVPPLDIAAIRERAATFGARERLRRIVLALAALLGVIGGAVAYAALGGGVHVWFAGNNVKVTVQSLAQIREPTAADVRDITAKAAFPIVFPVAVPRGMRVWWIAYDPADSPRLLTIEYRSATGGSRMSVTLIDEAKIRSDQSLLPGGPLQALTSKIGRHWQIGRELVLVQGRELSPASATRMRSAMQRSTPAASESAFDATLRRIVVLQKVEPRVADAAERIASAGRNVIIGDWDIRQLPRIAARGKPLRDSRLVYLTSIPQRRGQPIYRDATMYWPKAIAIPASGVRVIETTLRKANVGANCGCAILVHRSGNAYTVWKIETAPPYEAQKLSSP